MHQKIDFSNLVPKLPPFIARDHVEKLLGSVISPKTLANYDSLGEGPKRMRMGRNVVYMTEDLLQWLASRTTILN